MPDALGERLPPSLANRRVNWIEVARKDLTEARHSWLLWTLSGVFTVGLLLASLYPIIVFSAGTSELASAMGFAPLDSAIRWSVPLIALVVGAVAVVDERKARTLRVLLGLPLTRRDILIGTFLSRSIIISALVLVGLVPAGVSLWYFYTDFSFPLYGSYAALTLLLGLVFVSVGAGISAFCQSSARTLGASVSVFTLVTFVWHVVPNGVFYLVDGRFPGNIPPPWNPPAWFVFLGNANPVDSHTALSRALVSGDGQLGTRRYQSYVFEGEGPFYLQPEWLLLVLLLWAVIPLVVGGLRFSRSDLR